MVQHGDYALPGSGPTSFRAPGLPIVLAAIYASVGHSYFAAYTSFALFGSASCLLAYALTRELAEEATARVAAILCTFYVPHIYFATRFDSENLFVPVLAAAAWLLIRSTRVSGYWSIVATGLMLGFASLVRPFAILIAPAWLTIIAFDPTRRFPHRVISVLILLAGFVAVITPWTVRNYSVHRRFVLIATNGGSTFYGANNDLVSADLPALGTWVATNWLPGRERIEATPDEVTHDKLEWALGLEWVQNHPERLPWLVAGKLVRLWLPDVESANQAYVAVQVLIFTPFLILIVVGWLCTKRRPSYRDSAWLVIRATLLATVVTALMFWGSPRFRDANAPVLMIYAAIGLQAITRRLG